jgi:hypothetical protein
MRIRGRESSGSFDPIARGVETGLARAVTLSLRHLDVGPTAAVLVQETLARQRTGTPVTASQVEVLAEFVTLALSVGVDVEDVSEWIGTICGEWG